jgi:hypothetical protein
MSQTFTTESQYLLNCSQHEPITTPRCCRLYTQETNTICIHSLGQGVDIIRIHRSLVNSFFVWTTETRRSQKFHRVFSPSPFPYCIHPSFSLFVCTITVFLIVHVYISERCFLNPPCRRGRNWRNINNSSQCLLCWSLPHSFHFWGQSPPLLEKVSSFSWLGSMPPLLGLDISTSIVTVTVMVTSPEMKSSDLRMTALARTSSNCERQTHPLIRQDVT